jgi:hypothetical protein
MKIEGITEAEVAGVKSWASADQISEDQMQMCIALERLGCNAMPEEIADYCSTSVDEIRALRNGIPGILVDANTGRFWIR